jgi:probable DNA metabolism protein
MTQLAYDGTMWGLLTAIFEVYERKLETVHIALAEQLLPDAFAERHTVVTNMSKANRVWKGLSAKLPDEAKDQFYYSFLSELPGMEDMLLAYARYVFSSDRNITEDFGHAAVLSVSQTARKVWREKHRMEAFVRFAQLKDELYYATVAPDYNVLPVIAKHFKSRYADQHWLIYDSRRKYGIHYNKDDGLVTEVQLNWSDAIDTEAGSIYAAHEQLYQQLWKDYFHSTGIPGRNNPKLQLQHMPLRYWKYLTEKQL